MELKEQIFNKKDENQKDLVNPKSLKKHTILSLSLIWFSYILIVTFSFGALLTWQAPVIKIWISSIFARNTIFAWTLIISLSIVQIVLMLVVGFFAHKLPLGWLAFFATLYALMMGVFIIPIIQFFVSQPLSVSFGLILIPSVTMLIMGLLGYFDVINFKKLWPLILALSISLIVVSLIAVFTINNSNQRILTLLISVLGFIVMALYMGLDFWIISKQGKYITEYEIQIEKKELNRLGLLFGLHLAIDFIYMLLYVFRIYQAVSK